MSSSTSRRFWSWSGRRLWWTRWRPGCRRRRGWWLNSARSWRRAYGTRREQWDSKVTELEDDLELRVGEFGMARKSSRSWHMPSRTWSDGVTRSRISTYDLFKILSRTWSNAGLEGAPPAQDGMQIQGASVRQSTVVAPFSDDIRRFASNVNCGILAWV